MILSKLFIDTKTGKHVVSKSNDICVNFVQYEFTDASDTWTINHVYETEALTLQSFSDNIMFIAENVVIWDSNTITLHAKK